MISGHHYKLHRVYSKSIIDELMDLSILQQIRHVRCDLSCLWSNLRVRMVVVSECSRSVFFTIFYMTVLLSSKQAYQKAQISGKRAIVERNGVKFGSSGH